MQFFDVEGGISFALADMMPAILEDMLLAEGDQAVQRRGRDYAAQGRVTSIRLPDPYLLNAEVRGSGRRPYRVTIESYDDSMVEFDCSCPVGVECKHIYAVLYRIAGAAYCSGRPWAIPLSATLPPNWMRVSAEALPAVKGDGLVGLLGTASDPPPPATAETDAPSSSWWESFLEADMYQRASILEGVIRSHITGHFFVPAIRNRLAQFAQDLNPLRALVEFQEFALGLPVRPSPRSPIVDPAFVAFMSSDTVRAMWAALAEREADLRLVEWLDQSEAAPDASIALEWQLGEYGYDFPVLSYRLLLTAKKLVRSARHGVAIEQLASDLRNQRRKMNAADERVVQWLAAQTARPANPGADSLDTAIRVHSIHAWQTHVPAPLWTWDDGTPVRIASEPARMTIVPEEDRFVWAITFTPPGALEPVRMDPKSLTLFFERAPYYQEDLDDLRLWIRHSGWILPLDTAGLAIGLVILLLNRREVPVGLLQERGLGGRLVQRLQQGGTAAEGLTAEVPVKTRAEFHVTGGHLHVAVVAEASDGSTFHYAGNNHWTMGSRITPVDLEGDEEPAEELTSLALPGAAMDVEALSDDAALPAAAARALALRPREADLRPVVTWLSVLLPVPGSRGTTPTGLPALTYKLDDALRYNVLEHWGERPAGVPCLGNRAMQAMVVLRRPPEFKIDFSSSGVDWLEVSVGMQEEMELLTAQEVAAALAQTGQLVQLPRRGTYQRDELEAYQQQLAALAEIGLEPNSPKQRLHTFQLAGPGLAAFEDAEGALRKFAEQARTMAESFKGIPSAKVAKEPASALRPYQRAGVDFLMWSASTFGGAVLADDMGLGKTLQVLAALTAMRAPKANKKLPSLVVCPASVAHNWQREAQRFAPGLKTVVIERGPERKLILENLDQYDLVIKNYALTRRDSEVLEKQQWLMVCVDEAQAIKNPDAAITKVVKGLQARYRIALTGTPIENRAMDLWSIIDFAVPGYLGARSRFEARDKANSGALHGYLRARLRPVLLRRLKQEVAPELPPRIEERLDCEMTPKQRQAYLAELKRTRDLLAKKPGNAVQGQARIQMLAALTRLRQICCDPRLRGLNQLGSGKLSVLMETLQPLLESGHKVLVFSQFVEMLKLIEHELVAMKTPYYMLTGKTTQRQELVEAFEADVRPVIFLISLKAGGTGLNLTSASHVVLFDPWWNPAAEAQAIDRTHRIGQDKTVLAFRLVTVNTIEDRILELQDRKRDLVKNILEAESFNRSLTREDFDFLLQES